MKQNKTIKSKKNKWKGNKIKIWLCYLILLPHKSSHIKCTHYLAAKEISMHSTIKSTNKFLSTSLLSWNHVRHLMFLNNHQMFCMIGKKRLNIWNFSSQATEERNKVSNCGRSSAGNYNPSYSWKLQTTTADAATIAIMMQMWRENFKILEVVATIVIVDHNLKPWRETTHLWLYRPGKLVLHRFPKLAFPFAQTLARPETDKLKHSA